MIETTNLTIFFLMVAVVAFIIGLSKGAEAGTLGALGAPLMALVIPAKQALGLVLPILMIADIFAVALHWRRWNADLVVLLLPGAIVGVTIGTLFLTNAPTEVIQRVLGAVVLLFTLYKVFEKRIMGAVTYVARDWHGMVAGVICGAASALAHNGGPPVSIYLLMQDVEPPVFISTAAIFFMLLNWIKIPYYYFANLFDVQKLLSIIWLMPLVPAGVWVGRWIGYRLKKATFDWIVVGLIGLTGILLVFAV
jgi:uncharacterized membrane protein YfcA